jgi:poly(3-hydroxybutyrate) depolymerase
MNRRAWIILGMLLVLEPCRAQGQDVPLLFRQANPPQGAIWLDSLDLSKAVQGWGQTQAGKSVEGKPISIAGTKFIHGIGTHALGGLTVQLDACAERFVGWVGVDDETNKQGSVVFQVWLDGRKAYESPVMRGGQKPLAASVELRGVRRMTLMVLDAGDGGESDHADWAGVFLRLLPGAKARPQVVAFDDPTPPPPPPPQKPGQWPGAFRKTAPGEPFTGKYLLFLPSDYSFDPKRTWPMLVFLHGAGERGPNLDMAKVHGPPMLAERDENFRKNCPMIVLTPQTPPDADWQTPLMQEFTIALIGEICGKYRVDRDRISVTGLSMGGTGTWAMAMKYPERFAAISPICARALEPATVATKLKSVAVHTYVGSDDGDFTTGTAQMVQALKAGGCKVEETVVKGAGHGVWADIYPQPSFYKWLIEQRRPGRPSVAGSTTRPAGRSG